MTCCPECLGALEYWAGSDKSAHAGWYCKSGGCPNISWTSLQQLVDLADHEATHRESTRPEMEAAIAEGHKALNRKVRRRG